MPAALLLTAAHKPLPPSGELVLDAANPVVEVQIAGVPLRLRVDLDQHDNIELNPAAAAALSALKWEAGLDTDVGRVRLHSRIAPAILRIDGREQPSQVAEHGRNCCAGSDGAIGPDLLPFATVRWRRDAAPSPTATRTLSLADSPMFGLSAAGDIGKLRLRFALTQPETVGTAAAGALLAQEYGGHWNGAPRHVTLAFGVSRPARIIAFARNVNLAGFPFDQLLLRISDFAGEARLPTDPVDPGDIVVTRHLDRQRAWPAITLGADRLSRCAEIAYTAVPRTLTLRCAFD
ncbi:hypothetical protein [Sphingomonas crusticola]|uniref:hypothetical protein n=1 Tax=Sphingomonas crusticola TaxID=1697973 RepID=UPI000E21DB26|nr:hypothetical protein [Sphingomonas crusticola]